MFFLVIRIITKWNVCLCIVCLFSWLLPVPKKTPPWTQIFCFKDKLVHFGWWWHGWKCFTYIGHVTFIDGYYWQKRKRGDRGKSCIFLSSLFTLSLLLSFLLPFSHFNYTCNNDNNQCSLLSLYLFLSLYIHKRERKERRRKSTGYCYE